MARAQVVGRLVACPWIAVHPALHSRRRCHASGIECAATPPAHQGRIRSVQRPTHMRSDRQRDQVGAGAGPRTGSDRNLCEVLHNARITPVWQSTFMSACSECHRPHAPFRGYRTSIFNSSSRALSSCRSSALLKRLGCRQLPGAPAPPAHERRIEGRRMSVRLRLLAP